MFKYLHTKKSQKGFTIIEVLVTSMLFSIIGLSVSAIFIQIVNLERRAFSVQKIQDNALQVLEGISRDMRVSRITDQESPTCLATNITLVHPIKGALNYRMSNGIIQRSTAGGPYEDISGSDVNFIRLNFCTIGSLANDNRSPMVTVITSVQNRTGREILQIDLQTTVTSRDVFDEFQN